MPYDVTITRLPLRALFELAGRLPDGPGDLPPPPPRPNSLTRRGERCLVHTGPGRWLLMAPLEDEAALAQALGRQAVLLSDTLTFFSVTGPGAADVMAVAVPLDLHADAFPPDAASLTDGFGTRVLVRRMSGGFEIGVDASFADWFHEMLGRVAS